MKLLSLGHACYLLEMDADIGGDPVRILADPWLSDYLIGDLQGRFPRLRFETRDLLPVHGIFISHSHTDHLDPYALIRLWREIQPSPALLLPQSMRCFAGLLRQYLEGVEIIFLEERTPIEFRGTTLTAFFNPERRPTNEDDVMVLSVQNGREVFFCESDALLPFYDPETREYLSDLVNQASDGACFLSIKNEGAATMAALAARDLEDRRGRVASSLEATCEEIYETYAELEEPLAGDLWQNPRLLRLIGGQGICFPQKLETQWNRVLFPIRLEDRVRLEREVVEQLECRHRIEEFVPGAWHDVRAGDLAQREDASFLTLLDQEQERHYDPGLALFDDFPQAPLRDEARDSAAQKRSVAQALNHRFLPYLIGQRAPPVEHLLAECGGEYRVRVRFGTIAVHEDVDFRLAFDDLRFNAGEARAEAHEFYWANDIEDVLEGRSDEFSTLCRKPLPAPAQRFWVCLGLPYLNQDLISKKLVYHFERACQGKSLEDWVLGFFRT